MKDMTSYERVREFHRAMGQPLDVAAVKDTMRMLDGKLSKEEILDAFEGTGVTLDEIADMVELRDNLIWEEWEEFLKAKTYENTFKELADLVYVIMGLFAVAGVDFDGVFNEVHRSNMSKLDEDGKPIYREDGKVLKGPNYSPADIKRFL